MDVGRTDEELLGMYADFGTKDPEVAKRSFNFIPPGLELKLAQLDETSVSLGYYAEDIRNLLDMYRQNLPSVDGKSRWDMQVALSQKASARGYQRSVSWREKEEE